MADGYFLYILIYYLGYMIKTNWVAANNAA